jgi:serine/threonine protein kinase
VDQSHQYCINPYCLERINSIAAETCSACGTSLIIQGRYQLTEPLRSLDADSRYQIFAVRDLLDLEHPKIIKVLVRPDAKAIELFEREAYALKAMNHPGIPTVDLDADFQVPIREGVELHCLVQYRMDGQNLLAWLDEHSRISQDLVINWLNQLGKILHTVHEHGFFHRDIKPANLLLRPDGQLALLDFGAVREVSETYLAKMSVLKNRSVGYENEITSIFTIGYAAPEQFEGRAIPQSDFFSLGRTMVHLMTGIHPNHLSDINRIGHIIWQDKAPQISHGLKDFIQTLMDPLPRKRPRNSSDLVERLNKLPGKLRREKVLKSPVGVLIQAFTGAILIGLGIWAWNRVEASTRNNNAAEQNLVGMEFLVQGDYTKAKNAFQESLRIKPDDFRVLQNLAVTCEQIKDTECVTSAYQKSLELNPDNWVTYYNRGDFYESIQDYGRAETDYRQAVTINPAEALPAVSNLARLLILRGKYKLGSQLARQTLSQTNNPMILTSLHRFLGWVAFEQGDYTVAKRELLQAIALDSENVSAHCLLAKTADAADGDPSTEHWKNCFAYPSELHEVERWRSEFINKILPIKKVVE